jgi:hypothetical protein
VDAVGVDIGCDFFVGVVFGAVFVVVAAVVLDAAAAAAVVVVVVVVVVAEFVAIFPVSVLVLVVIDEVVLVPPVIEFFGYFHRLPLIATHCYVTGRSQQSLLLIPCLPVLQLFLSEMAEVGIRGKNR